MNKKARFARLSGHLLVLLLTVSLVTGICGFSEGAFASTSTGSPFSNTKSSYLHNTRFDGNLIVNGVDVSYFQSTASDWNKAKRDGCDYAIMRVTYTTYGSGTQNIDSKFATHFNKARAAGVMKGAYVFSQAKNVTEARKEAQYAVNRLRALGLGPKDFELPIYMDYEFAGGKRGRLNGLKKATAIDCVNAFAEVIRANGYDPGVYANTNFFKNYLGNGTSLATDIDMWCAQYYSRNESGCMYTKWQYSSTAKVDGILYYSTNKIGSCDVDFWYLNRKSNPSAITTVYGNTTLNYTGGAVRPTLEIYDGSKLLTEGIDYIVGGINNINQSTSGAYALVKGIGKYTGYALVPITIGTGFINHIGLSRVGGAGLGNTNGGKYSIGTNANGSYVRNVPSSTKVSTMLSKLKVNSGYKLAVVDAKGAAASNGTIIKTGMLLAVYKGSNLVGTADITVKGDTLNDRGANYIVKANRSANYSSAASAAPVTVKKTSIKKLSRGKKYFKVKVKKLKKNEASGYEIRYSTKKNMSGAVYKTVGTKYNKVSKKVKSLKTKKTYYVQARTYLIVNGNYYYSAWSGTKKVKTK